MEHSELTGKIGFNDLYDKEEQIGQGMTASVYICYKREDREKKTPYAAKFNRIDFRDKESK